MLARAIKLAQTPELRLFDAVRTPPLDTTMLVLPTLLIPIIFWWIYQYLDWRNDIFVVTPDQILDIDKKPFGTETRRAAPLENILSTEAERVGLAGYLLNFGTVYITIGGASLDFQDIRDPSLVQADIDRRRETRAARNAKWNRRPSANECPIGWWHTMRTGRTWMERKIPAGRPPNAGKIAWLPHRKPIHGTS
jgi:hypothetical protein